MSGDEARQPKTLDYTKHRGWGHDYHLHRLEDGGHVAVGSLHHPAAPSVGDWLLLPDRGGQVAYRITTLRWCVDPHDMWHFTAGFVPGSTIAEEIPGDTCGVVGR